LKRRSLSSKPVPPPNKGESKRGFAPLKKFLPLHAKNTSPYYGEGDKGDRVTNIPI